MDTVDIDVENLFNDGQLDQIITNEHALPTTTLALPGLAEHLLNSQFCGGLSRVAWSRQGHIAALSGDGTTLNVHCLRSSTKSKKWKLSVPRPIDTVLENAVNLTWSPLGFDLAVVDDQGRIGIYSMTPVCLNRLNESRPASVDAPDEFGMPIGTWWLNQDRQDRPRKVVSNSSRGDDKWVHNFTKAKALGPLYPRAFCAVNRRGVFNLVYQRPGARYTRTSTQLPIPPGTICSHAAFSPTTDAKILLVVHLINRGLAVFHIQITWPPDLMTDPTSTTQPDLAVETIDSYLSMWSDFEVADSTLPQSYKPDDWALTHLSIIPTSDVETAIQESPYIWAVYTLTNSANNSTENAFLMNSFIKRWSIYPSIRGLHPRFDDMPTKTESSTSNEDIFAAERLSDIVFPQVITSVDLVDGGQLVAISTADGKTELWNPATQAPVSYEGETNVITSLAQFGFSFAPTTTATNVTLSPNASAALTLPDELMPSIKYAQYHIQTASQSLDLTDAHQSASVAAVTLAFARSCWSNTHSDDVLACVQSNYTAYQYTTIVSEMYRTLFRDAEYIHEKAPGSEAERLVSNPITMKVLSFQLSLLNSSSISVTSADESIQFAALSNAWAWVAVNLRYVATTFYIFYREYTTSVQAQQNHNQSSPPPLSPSFVDAICNTIRWTLDLVRFMLTTILEIGDRQTNPDFFTPSTFANNLGDAAGDGSQGLVALILNCQWSRSFLITISRAMRAFIDVHEKGHNPLVSRIVHTIRRHSIGKGMNVTAMDKLLDPRWYTRSGLRDGEQLDPAMIAKRQIAMCSSGRVGPEYANTLRTLLEKVVNEPDTGLRATGEVERLKLWTEAPDFNWLLLGYNPQFWAEVHSNSANAFAAGNTDVATTSTKARKLYDIHRKSVIIDRGTPTQLVRRCVRCGSVSGDIDGPDKSWSKNMVGYLARCVCDAYWILEPMAGEIEGK